VPVGDTQVHRLPIFVHNLRYMTCVDDSETSIFENLHSKMSLGTRFSENQIRRAEVALKKSKEWKEWQSDMLAKSSGLISQNCFFRMLQKAQEALQSTAKSKQPRSVFVNIGTKAPVGIDNEDHAGGLKLFKPDLATVAPNVDEEKLGHRDMKTTWELKRSSSKGTAQSEIQLSLMRSNQVLWDDPFRRFIYSIYAAGSTLRLFQLNRGEVLSYDSVLDIQDNPLLFLRFVNWLMLANDAAHGLAGRPTSIGNMDINFTPSECKIRSPLVRVAPDLVTTRGTTVWPVEMKRRESKTKGKSKAEKTEGPGLALLKMAWPYEVRTNEADILHELNDVEELPRIFSTNEGPLTTEFDVLPEAEHSRQGLKVGPNSEQATMEFTQSSSMAPMTKEELIFHLPELDEIPEPTDEPPHARRQRWCLEEYCGVSVGTKPNEDIEHVHPSLSSPRYVTELERTKALRCVVTAIRKMFCREQPYLHRDISPSNIMVTSPDLLNRQDAPPPGRLIDLDLACVYGDPQSRAPWRTGTFLYMAIDMLMGSISRHHPWHDIESVFWVLFLGELNRTSRGAQERSTLASTVAGRTEAERASALAVAKASVVETWRWRRFMGENRPQFFEKTSLPVIRLMQRLRAELFEENERNEQGPLATFEDVAKAAKESVSFSPDYSSPRFAVPPEEVFDGKGVGESEKDLAIEKLRQAVATVTERLDGWFAECVDELETRQQEQPMNEAS